MSSAASHWKEGNWVKGRADILDTSRREMNWWLPSPSPPHAVYCMSCHMISTLPIYHLSLMRRVQERIGMQSLRGWFVLFLSDWHVQSEIVTRDRSSSVSIQYHWVLRRSRFGGPAKQGVINLSFARISDHGHMLIRTVGWVRLLLHFKRHANVQALPARTIRTSKSGVILELIIVWHVFLLVMK